MIFLNSVPLYARSLPLLCQNLTRCSISAYTEKFFFSSVVPKKNIHISYLSLQSFWPDFRRERECCCLQPKRFSIHAWPRPTKWLFLSPFSFVFTLSLEFFNYLDCFLVAKLLTIITRNCQLFFFLSSLALMLEKKHTYPCRVTLI